MAIVLGKRVSSISEPMSKNAPCSSHSNDVGQRTIGHILGHAAGNVTVRYIKRHLPTMRRALEKLERAIWEEDEMAKGSKAAGEQERESNDSHVAKRKP
jgi:hypothetical protein